MPMDILSTRRVAEAMECTQDADDLSILVNVRKANAILAANRATWANILHLGATKTANMRDDANELSTYPDPSRRSNVPGLTHEQMMKDLLNDPKFWDKGKEFIGSLYEDFKKRGSLSVKQILKLEETYNRQQSRR